MSNHERRLILDEKRLVEDLRKTGTKFYESSNFYSVETIEKSRDENNRGYKVETGLILPKVADIKRKRAGETFDDISIAVLKEYVGKYIDYYEVEV